MASFNNISSFKDFCFTYKDKRYTCVLMPFKVLVLSADLVQETFARIWSKRAERDQTHDEDAIHTRGKLLLLTNFHHKTFSGYLPANNLSKAVYILSAVFNQIILTKKVIA